MKYSMNLNIHTLGVYYLLCRIFIQNHISFMLFQGTHPNLAHHKQGDPFYIRNDYALNIDKRIEPPMYQVSDTHYVASWLLHENAPDIDMPSTLKNRINRMKLEASKYE